MRKIYKKTVRHKEGEGKIMSSGKRTGQLCNAKLMRHKRAFQGIYGEVCIREQEQVRGAYNCHMSWYLSISL